MKIRAILVLLAAFSTHASEFGVGFPDGTWIKIEAKSTGPNVQTPHGGSVQSEGLIWHRVIGDKQGVLFAYDLEAWRVPGGTGAHLRISPVGSTFAQKVGAGKVVPTVAALRDFPEVKYGDRVELEVLYNPATRDKIYDVLQPTLKDPVRNTQGQFTLQGLRISINGQVVWTDNGGGSITGDLAVILLPGRGAYHLALARPDRGAYEQIGRIEGNRLTFTAGGDRFEITGKSNLLRDAQSASVWVYHNPHAKAVNEVIIGTSDFPSRP